MEVKPLQRGEKGERLVCDNRHLFLWKNLDCPGPLPIPGYMDTLFCSKRKELFVGMSNSGIPKHPILRRWKAFIEGFPPRVKPSIVQREGKLFKSAPGSPRS